MTARSSPPDAPRAERVRLDRWLWAARFFRTRALAKGAVEAGHVQLAGQRTKPAREVTIGARLVIRRGPDQFVVTVTGVAEQRGPAKIARTLYEESPASIEARETERSQRRMERAGLRVPRSRPNARARRELRDLTESSGGEPFGEPLDAPRVEDDD